MILNFRWAGEDLKSRLFGRIPSTTRFYGTMVDANHIFIIMEHCGKGDLLEWLLKGGRAMTESQVVNMVRWASGRCNRVYMAG